MMSTPENCWIASFHVPWGAIEETDVAKKKIMTITKARSKKEQLEFKIIAGKRILQLGGVATAVGDIDQAIRDLRKTNYRW